MANNEMPVSGLPGEKDLVDVEFCLLSADGRMNTCVADGRMTRRKVELVTELIRALREDE